MGRVVIESLLLPINRKIIKQLVRSSGGGSSMMKLGCESDIFATTHCKCISHIVFHSYCRPKDSCSGSYELLKINIKNIIFGNINWSLINIKIVMHVK